MRQVDGFKGFVGYGIRELTSNESNMFCNNSTSLLPQQLSRNVTFKSDFAIRAFTLGCYYYDISSGKWSSNGLDLLNDTTLDMTHCTSTHLTSFAGGLVVLPNAINFQYVWANASFIQNPLIYSTVIAITCLYVALVLWAHLMDKKDRGKINLVGLIDDSSICEYFYEVIVFTGEHSEAGTNSKVRLVINGSRAETDIKCLNEANKHVFAQNGVDSFVLGVTKPLGSLNYVRIWHDNTGKRDMASWYLKYIIVHDLQTRQKDYFLLEDWLAVEKSDGKIDRTLFVACEKQKTDLKFLVQKELRDKLRDDHLWFSIFSRPVQSTFSRSDRVTCAFVILFISMLMNIMYYDLGSANDSAKTSGLKLGPFYLTVEQVIF